jgi:hypothetical protein
MRIRGCTIEYELNEAAKMLDISNNELKQGVEAGYFRYYYQLGARDYRFHEASIVANRELLTQRQRISYGGSGTWAFQM